jgi:hypothetical protein
LNSTRTATLDHIGDDEATANLIADLRIEHGDPVPKLALLRAGITKRRYGQAICDWTAEIARLEGERRAFELLVAFAAQQN